MKLLLFAVAGLLAQLVDGALGMAFGITAELVTATGPSGGVDALVDAVRRATGPVHVAPLFISPGTLWDAAVDVLSSLPDNLSVTTGVPLDTAVAPLTAHRARERNAG
jgi:sirohydrochlorin cobaltochelatase